MWFRCHAPQICLQVCCALWLRVGCISRSPRWTEVAPSKPASYIGGRPICGRRGGVNKKCRCSCAPATYQRSLHYILAHCPITASSIQFCLLCCQPEPFPGLLSCQGITACAMKTLQTTCLIGVNHRHVMQDLVSSATLHHPDLKEAIGGLTLPAIMSKSGSVWECDCRCSGTERYSCLNILL